MVLYTVPNLRLLAAGAAAPFPELDCLDVKGHFCLFHGFLPTQSQTVCRGVSGPTSGAGSHAAICRRGGMPPLYSSPLSNATAGTARTR